MPDHYHLLAFLASNKPLSAIIMKSIGQHTGKEINRLLERQGSFWQEGFYDHRCRDEQEIENGMVYIEHNPVRKGLVEKAEDWTFSSANTDYAAMLDRDWYAVMR